MQHTNIVCFTPKSVNQTVSASAKRTIMLLSNYIYDRKNMMHTRGKHIINPVRTGSAKYPSLQDSAIPPELVIPR
jgi:hypothetical protein